jgi:hypothetical protein
LFATGCTPSPRKRSSEVSDDLAVEVGEDRAHPAILIRGFAQSELREDVAGVRLDGALGEEKLTS